MKDNLKLLADLLSGMKIDGNAPAIFSDVRLQEGIKLACDIEHCSENWDFLLKMHELVTLEQEDKLTPNAKQQALAELIKIFIDPPKNSPWIEINISSEMRELLLQKFRENTLTLPDFQPAVEEVYNMLRSGAFLRVPPLMDKLDRTKLRLEIHDHVVLLGKYEQFGTNSPLPLRLFQMTGNKAKEAETKNLGSIAHEIKTRLIDLDRRSANMSFQQFAIEYKKMKQRFLEVLENIKVSSKSNHTNVSDLISGLSKPAQYKHAVLKTAIAKFDDGLDLYQQQSRSRRRN